jgi:hypothetical protein
MTALYDAVGRTINAIEARIKQAKSKDRPEKVILVVITDGHENSSKEFRGFKVKEMIGEQREKNMWEVIFIGADEGMMNDADNMGLGMTRGAGGQSVNATYSMSLNSAMASKTAYAMGVSAKGSLSTAFNHPASASTIADNSTMYGGLTGAYDAITTAVSNYRSKGTVGDWTKGEDLTKE